MSTRTVLEPSISERVSAQLQCTLTRANGSPLLSADTNSIVLTLYNDDKVRTKLNGVDHINVFNFGRGTFGSTDGLLTIMLQPADNGILDANKMYEDHVALIEFVYDSGAGNGRHEMQFRVNNMNYVP